MDLKQRRKVILQVFTKNHGLTLQSDALIFLEGLLDEGNIPSDQLEEVLDHIVNSYRSKEDVSSLVKKELLEDVVHLIFQENRHRGSDFLPALLKKDLDPSSHFHVIDAFDTIAFRFDPFQKTYIRDMSEKKLTASTFSRSKMIKERTSILQQRLSQSSLVLNNKDIQFTAVSSLLGSSGSKYLIGYIHQLKEGAYFLEDHHGHVELDLKDARCSNGLFTEGNIIIVEGEMIGGVFCVTFMGLPPPEKKRVTLSLYNNLDVNLNSSHRDRQDLLTEIESNPEIMFIFISEVWLDDPKVLSALDKLFDGLQHAKPFAFVLMGDFCSTLVSASSFPKYRELFGRLGEIVLKYNWIARNSRFIFVPGPHDPIISSIWPRPAIPEYFYQRLRNYITNYQFVSNPCRIKYCTQEIVIFRHSLSSQMHRNCILEPRNDNELKNHLVKTIVDSAHLLPLPQSVQPIYWDFDHAMRLNPLPDVILLGDSFEPFKQEYEECIFANSGSFSQRQKFSVYFPASKEMEPRYLQFRGSSIYSAIK